MDIWAGIDAIFAAVLTHHLMVRNLVFLTGATDPVTPDGPATEKIDSI